MYMHRSMLGYLGIVTLLTSIPQFGRSEVVTGYPEIHIYNTLHYITIRYDTIQYNTITIQLQYN